jgi:hypothetical protein|tara:strand:- start:781 stop:921 length:141 start_codon:yes stop_codon:yes gene_type:complete
MQIKVEAMKNLRTPKADGKRDHWRKHNKLKTLRIKQARQQKRFAQG